MRKKESGLLAFPGEDVAEQTVEIEPAEPLFERRPAKKKSVKGKARKKKNNQRTMLIILSAAIGLVITAGAVYYVYTQNRIAAEIQAQIEAEQAELAAQQAQYEEWVNATTFCTGVSVDGTDISGMTMAEAEQTIVDKLNAALATGTMDLVYNNKPYAFDISSIVSTHNVDTVLEEAFRVGKTGADYAAVKAELDDTAQNGRVFTLTASYDFAPVTAGVAEIAAQVDAAPVNASISSVDKEARTFAFSEAVEGVIVDQNALIAAITQAITTGNYNPITIPVTTSPASITKADLEGIYKLRASYSTSFSGSTSNRKYNIRKGAALINGTVLKPDQVFSTNDTLGDRTYSNGWKEAGAYVSGAVDQQAGGGVCQLSSTLYNAVVKADLEIVYRQNHSMPVSYIKQGLDATINSIGNRIDFQFKNNTTTDVIIFAYTSGNDVIFEIYGQPFATSEYDEIKLSSEKTGTIEPSGPTVETLDETMAPGTSEVKVARQNGSKWQSYKNYYLNGKLVRSEKLAASTYKAFAGEILVGPTVTVVTPDPTITTPDPGTTTQTNSPEPSTPEPNTPEPVEGGNG